MLGIPSIRSAIVVGECGFEAFERQIRIAKDGLTQIVKAMNHVPMMVVRNAMVRLQTRISLHDRKEAMDLMCDRGCEDCLLWPYDRRR